MIFDTKYIWRVSEIIGFDKIMEYEFWTYYSVSSMMDLIILSPQTISVTTEMFYTLIGRKSYQKMLFQKTNMKNIYDAIMMKVISL